MHRSPKPPRVDPSRLDHSIGYAIAQAAITTNRIYAERIGEPHGLRQVEFSLLQLIAANADVTQKRLCEALCVPPPQMTLIIERLLERGLVERERGESDRRSQSIRLTAAGDALANATLEVSLHAEAQALAGVTAAERAMLVELLNKVAAHRR